MKILQLTQRIPFPLHDGGAIAMYKVTEYLHKNGHEVTVLALNTNKHAQNPEVMKSICRIFAIPINTDIQITSALQNLFFSNLPYNVARFLSEDYSLALQKLLETETFDIIQLEGIHLALYAGLIKNHAPQTPLVLRAHNVEAEIWQRLASNEKNWLKKWYLNSIAKRLARFENLHLQDFDGIIAITEKDKQNFENQGYKGKITSIPAGVEMNPITPLPNNPFHLGYLGSLEWLPNEEALLRFIEQVFLPLHAQDSRWQLSIAGKNPPQRMLEWNFSGVHILGEVADAGEFRRQFDILVIPLLSGSGMRVKLIECMAEGRCVVSSAIGAEGVDIKSGNQAWIVNTANEWKNCLKELANNPEKIHQTARHARAWTLENYDWNNLITKMLEFYNILQKL